MNEEFEIFFVDDDDIDSEYELLHYGTKRHSGRYPWGSGDNPYQRSGDFLSACSLKEKNGIKEKTIADGLGLSIEQYRTAKAIAKHERQEQLYCEAKKLMDSGLSRNAAAKQIGCPESTLRAVEKAQAEFNRSAARKTADLLKAEIEKKGVIDVGEGVELELGISRTKLKEALYILEAENGYMEGGIGVKNTADPTGRKQTNVMVLCKDYQAYKDAYADNSKIKSVVDYHSNDDGKTFTKIKYPSSLDSSRVAVRYAEDGGKDYDGVIEIRPGCKDLSLGNSHYAQVRIMVDNSHYLKGMAVYSDDIPAGKDVVFNTNKHKGTPMLGDKDNTVLKTIKGDPNNPFGATIKYNGQYEYFGSDGKEHLSPINKLKEEGEWDTSSSKNLSSQFLSKQPRPLIKKQLGQAYDDKKAEFDSIMALTNPTVKRKLLNEFADSCESDAIHMRGAALPRQRTHVLIPVKSLKDNEIFAPNYENGEHVVLIRYPHGGTFEIPELVVNNKNPEGRKRITKNARDAVGINSQVAERLSGADFDGDTVVLIPVNDKVKVKTSKPLEGLKNFDPKERYPYRPGMSVMQEKDKQKQMGIVSNLITDMTLKGATSDELAAAVRHSMVVIDSVKHRLDYRQSEIDNNIDLLKRTYQSKPDGKYGGASTLLSKRKQDVRVPERKGSPIIDRETGKVSWKETGRTYEKEKKVTDPETGKVSYVKTGKMELATTKEKLITLTDDLHTLSSGTNVESYYADYGNSMKALANMARKEMLATEKLTYNPTAYKTYRQEVDSLRGKLKVAQANKPKERQAQAKANGEIKRRKFENPDMTNEELKKLKTQATARARQEVGASGKDSRIDITDKEWEAIQAGAIHDTTLMTILRFSDPDKVRELSLPKEAYTLTTAKKNRIKLLAANGYTNQEIAKAIGASVSTISKYLNE